MLTYNFLHIDSMPTGDALEFPKRSPFLDRRSKGQANSGLLLVLPLFLLFITDYEQRNYDFCVGQGYIKYQCVVGLEQSASSTRSSSCLIQLTLAKKSLLACSSPVWLRSGESTYLI